MLDQSINPDSLKFVISDYERDYLFKSDFAQSGEKAIIKKTMDFFYDEKSIYNPPSYRLFNGKTLYTLKDCCDYFLTKRFITTFKTINFLKQSNRLQIVDTIIALIQEHKPYSILRLDIKEFYESIDRTKLLDDLSKDSIYSDSTLEILRKMFSMLDRHGIAGLPRGFSVSPVLAEYYLRPFDKKCKNMNSVFYYARFVDDIIIFTTDNLDTEKLACNLPDGLMFHTIEDKCKTINVPHLDSNTIQKFSYLGYEFNLRFISQRKGYDYLVDISPKKINKIKTRIVKSFLAYKKDKNYLLLLDRIRFLTHNFYIHNRHRNTKIKSGIYYNYKKITIDKFDELSKQDKLYNSCSLNQLDLFLRKMIFDAKFSKRILGYSHGLSKTQAKKMAKFSFNLGFREKRFWNFTAKDLKQINKCWTY